MTIFALTNFADMVKLVDMPDLGSGAARRVGSSPIIRTESPNVSLDFFYLLNQSSKNKFQIQFIYSTTKYFRLITLQNLPKQCKE